MGNRSGAFLFCRVYKRLLSMSKSYMQLKSAVGL